MKRKLNKYDISLIAAVIIVNLILLVIGSKKVSNAGGNTAYVYSDDKLIGKYLLGNGYSDEFTIKSEEGVNTVHIENDNVWVSDSNCPDKYCQLQGKAAADGDIIVCLPNKLVIKVVGKDDDIDFIAQ
jgi:hypothetical protein